MKLRNWQALTHRRLPFKTTPLTAEEKCLLISQIDLEPYKHFGGSAVCRGVVCSSTPNMVQVLFYFISRTTL